MPISAGVTTSLYSPHGPAFYRPGNGGRPLSQARRRPCRAVRSASVPRGGAGGGLRRRAREARSRLATPFSAPSTSSRAALPERAALRTGRALRVRNAFRPCGVRTTVPRARGRVRTGPGGASSTLRLRIRPQLATDHPARAGRRHRSECVLSFRPLGVGTTVRTARLKVGVGPGGAQSTPRRRLWPQMATDGPIDGKRATRHTAEQTTGARGRTTGNVQFGRHLHAIG